MKKMISLVTVVLMLTVIFAACGKADSISGNKIDPAVTGVWYGPSNSVKLDIAETGSGLVIIGENSHPAIFTTENATFTVSSEAYNLQGAYEITGEKLAVKANYQNIEYVVVFTRTPIAIPEEYVGTCIYMIGEQAYELTIENDGSGSCRGLPNPPSADYPDDDIYVIQEGEEIHIFWHPPVGPDDSEADKPVTEIENETETNDGTETPSSTLDTPATSSTTDTTTPGSSENTQLKPEHIPETLQKKDNEFVVVLPNGEEVKTIPGGGSIVGTWISEKVEGSTYVYGYYAGSISMKYIFTFNADGTGTVIAGIFPGTFTYTYDGYRLDLTITMLGQTKSGTGFCTIMGDTCYLENLDGEVYPLARQG